MFGHVGEELQVICYLLAGEELADMADGPAVQVRWQGKVICFVSFGQSCIVIAVPVTGW